jgi:hypothetical protein
MRNWISDAIFCLSATVHPTSLPGVNMTSDSVGSAKDAALALELSPQLEELENNRAQDTHRHYLVNGINCATDRAADTPL